MSYWDDHGFDPYEDDEEVETTCKYCGMCRLYRAVQVRAGWRLFDSDGDIHYCRRDDDPARAFAAPLKNR